MIAFHQSGLEKRTRCDFERSRTAATRSTTYKGSKNFKMLFFEENDVWTLTKIEANVEFSSNQVEKNRQDLGIKKNPVNQPPIEVK